MPSVVVCGVGEGELDPVADVLIRERVEHDAPLAAVAHQALAAHDAQMLGGRRLGDPDGGRGVGDRQIAGGQERHGDAQSRGFAEGVERSRDRPDGLRVRHAGSGRRHLLRLEQPLRRRWS